MVQMLKPSEYGRCAASASGLQDQCMALAVLEGTRPGIVLANNDVDPSAVFIAAPEDGFAWTYLAGDPSDTTFGMELRRWWSMNEVLARTSCSRSSCATIPRG